MAITPDLAARIADAYAKAPRGQDDDLHNAMVEAVVKSKEFATLLGSLAAGIYGSSMQFMLTHDHERVTEVFSMSLAMVELGYKMRTCEELEKLALCSREVVGTNSVTPADYVRATEAQGIKPINFTPDDMEPRTHAAHGTELRSKRVPETAILSDETVDCLKAWWKKHICSDYPYSDEM